MQAFYAPVENRCILMVEGDDRHAFLHSLVTNDIGLLKTQPAIYAALLSPQGRFLHDFIITELPDALRLEVEKERCEDLLKRLAIYKLRSKVALKCDDEWKIIAFSGNSAELTPALQDYAYPDPRHASLGMRLVVPSTLEIPHISPFHHYDMYRLVSGVPDGSRDMLPEKAIILEYGLDELQGISWKKGCYPGQELNARTRHLGVLRKSIFPVTLSGKPSPFGTKIMLENDEVGMILSSVNNRALCRLRLDAVKKSQEYSLPLLYEGGHLALSKPAWLQDKAN